MKSSRFAAYYQNKSFWLYAPILALYIYLYVHIVNFHANTPTNPIISIMYLIELGAHEGSHLVTALLPEIVMLAAGSIGEVTFTVLVAVAAWRARAYFVSIFGWLWVALSCNSAGNYMADARSQKLQLTGFSSDPIHDWHYVFGHLGLLPYDQIIGGTVRYTGDVIGFLALLFGAWLIFKMATVRHSQLS